MIAKETAKKILGDLPLTAELYWLLRQNSEPPVGGYHLDNLEKYLPQWLEQAQAVKTDAQEPKRVLVFGVLRYWLEHTLITSLALAALGHDVTLTYLPYAHWKKHINRFDSRRQDMYVKSVVEQVKPFIGIESLLDAPQARILPAELAAQMPAAAFRDTQYSLLREDIDPESVLYYLRQERNEIHARRMLAYMQKQRPDVVVVPNGSILEFGITYRVARYLGIPVNTYEFGEQDSRMWLAQNDDVMRQDTSALWAARGKTPLTTIEKERIEKLFASRQGANLWQNFARQWQDAPKVGGSAVRRDLGLDSRPLVLIPANVLGDSLTLGRHLFSESMTEWMTRTIKFFGQHPEAQLVIRVHPGERVGWGLSVYDILLERFKEFPENVRVLPADSTINTYDLVDAADFGLVFTTTTGMEMALIGKPVIVSGQTHYRGKGFTLDADSWDGFFELLEKVLQNPRVYYLSEEQVELAWRYAYRFFFEYPQPYPWRVPNIWKSVENWSIERVFSPEGIERFGNTFRYLVGDPIDWSLSRLEDESANE